MKTSKYVNKIDSQLNVLYNKINELRKDPTYAKYQHFEYTLAVLDGRIKSLSNLPADLVTDRIRKDLEADKKEYTRVSTLFDLFLNEEV